MDSVSHLTHRVKGQTRDRQVRHVAVDGGRLESADSHTLTIETHLWLISVSRNRNTTFRAQTVQIKNAAQRHWTVSIFNWKIPLFPEWILILCSDKLLVIHSVTKALWLTLVYCEHQQNIPTKTETPNDVFLSLSSFLCLFASLLTCFFRCQMQIVVSGSRFWSVDEVQIIHWVSSVAAGQHVQQPHWDVSCVHRPSILDPSASCSPADAFRFWVSTLTQTANKNTCLYI